MSNDNLKKHMKRLHEEPVKYKVCASVEIRLCANFSADVTLEWKYASKRINNFKTYH